MVVTVVVVVSFTVFALSKNSFSSTTVSKSSTATTATISELTTSSALSESSVSRGLSTISTTATSPPSEVDYVTSSSPNSSQWLILSADLPPVQITANDSGMLPEYSSGTALNQTFIGEQCQSVSNGDVCSSFKFVAQTGWFFDTVHDVLFIHYVGGPDVEIRVDFSKSQ